MLRVYHLVASQIGNQLPIWVPFRRGANPQNSGNLTSAPEFRICIDGRLSFEAVSTFREIPRHVATYGDTFQGQYSRSCVAKFYGPTAAMHLEGLTA